VIYRKLLIIFHRYESYIIQFFIILFSKIIPSNHRRYKSIWTISIIYYNNISFFMWIIIHKLRPFSSNVLVSTSTFFAYLKCSWTIIIIVFGVSVFQDIYVLYIGCKKNVSWHINQAHIHFLERRQLKQNIFI